MKRKTGAPEAPGMDLRRNVLRAGPARTGADYVLYWMQAQRRLRNNLALEEAIGLANELRLPVFVYEGLRPDYPEANARLHTIIVEGMRDNSDDAARRGLAYAAYVPNAESADRDLLAKLARRAAVVVTDEYPAFIFRRQTEALARKIDCPLVTIDNATIVPMREFSKREFAARTIRPKIHARLDPYMHAFLELDPERDGLSLKPDEFTPTDVARLSPAEIVTAAGVDQSVPPSRMYRGGRTVALRRLHDFTALQLDDYAEARNDTGVEGTSRLSHHLHFGFVGPLEVALAVRETRARSESVDAFLEELIVRRELSFNFTFFEPKHTSVEALPNWARATLEKHMADPRPDVAIEDVETGQTYDEIWNLAQRELLATGEILNYVRMLWGKKILEWSQSPQDAVDLMIRLHHRYALDGRSPLTYTNILWILGLHDRAWGPERPIFGTVRYMSSDAFRRKHDAKAYRSRVERAERIASAPDSEAL